MARGFWEHLLALLFLPLSIVCCCGVTRFAQMSIDALIPRLGTGIGLFVTALCAAFYLLAAIGAALTRGEPIRARAGVTTVITGTLAGGACLTWLVMTRFPGTEFEHHAGLIGFGLLLLGLVALPFRILEDRELRRAQAQARQDVLERIRSGAPPFSAEAEPPDA
jgi:hypothetical protein